MAAGEKKENKLIERHGSKKVYEPGREKKKNTERWERSGSRSLTKLQRRDD